MKLPSAPLFLLLPALALSAACGGSDASRTVEPPAVVWHAGPPLPQPLTNNAVTAMELDDAAVVFSFMGLDSTKAWSGITSAAYRWDTDGSKGWRAVAPVPGPGRLAATAQALHGKVYLFGGYTVAEDGAERSLPNVDIYDPLSDRWTRGHDIPLPTDDAVSGVWRDSLIILVSGWHDGDNVAAVQWYDPAKDAWSSASPILGAPVFGHSGALAGSHVVYVDGVRTDGSDPRFVMDTASWEGVVDPENPSTVTWSRIPDHPEPVLYRAAAGAVGPLVLLVGGSAIPYNYDGMGYDGRPAIPLRQALAYAPSTGAWRVFFAPPAPSMDHRGLGVADGRVFLVGGMGEDRKVLSRVWYARIEDLLGYVP